MVWNKIPFLKCQPNNHCRLNTIIQDLPYFLLRVPCSGMIEVSMVQALHRVTRVAKENVPVK